MSKNPYYKCNAESINTNDNSTATLNWSFFVKAFVLFGMFIWFNLSLSPNWINSHKILLLVGLGVLLFIVFILLATGFIRDEGFKGKTKNNKKKTVKAPTEPIKKKSNFSFETLSLLSVVAFGLFVTIGNILWKTSN